MLRSLYSGIAGMKAHQVKMDVIGNNIANVNTTGFKAGRVTFADMLNQTIRGAIAPGEGGAGFNPAQVGLGVKLGSIDTLFTQGGLQPTERTTDLALQGNGLFTVKTMVNDVSQYFYTRDGALSLDGNGVLVHTATGLKVQVWEVEETTGEVTSTNFEDMKAIQLSNDSGSQVGDDTIPISKFETGLITYSIGRDGLITGLFEGENPDDPPVSKKMGKLAIASFPNVEGLLKQGNNLYQLSASSGVPEFNNGSATVEAGYLEMSNIDLTAELTNMIVTQRGFQANSRIITTSDSMLEEVLSLKR